MEQAIALTGAELKELLNPKNAVKVLVGLSGLLFEKIDKPAQHNGDKGETAAPTAVTEDDLTRINGIGPTFAQRLKEAGITSFQKLTELTPDYLKEVAKAADWQADPADWIAQAKTLA